MPGTDATTHPLDDPPEWGPPILGHGRSDDMPCAFRREALQVEGLYLASPDRETRTELLHQQLIQVAAQGRGFCYLHYSTDAPRDLLAKLPDHRLDDVIWLDLNRKARHRAELDCHPNQRITVDPLATSDVPDTPDDPLTPPALARVTDILDIVQASRRADWATLALCETALTIAVERGASLHDVELWLGTADGLTDDLNRLQRTAARVDDRLVTAMTTAYHRDSRAIERANKLMAAFTVGPNDKVFRDTTDISVADAVQDDALLIVAGSGASNEYGPHVTLPDRTWGTQLLAAATIRRLWEALQATRASRSEPYPIAVDGVDRLFARDATIRRELLTHHERTPATPWLTGPAPSTCPLQLQQLLESTIGAWALVSEEPTEDIRTLLEELNHRNQSRSSGGTSISFEACPGWMTFGDTDPMAFEPYPAYPHQRDHEAVTEAITRSCTDHGHVIPPAPPLVDSPSRAEE